MGEAMNMNTLLSGKVADSLIASRGSQELPFFQAINLMSMHVHRVWKKFLSAN